MSKKLPRKYADALIDQARDIAQRAGNRIARDREREPFGELALGLHRLEYDQLVDLARAYGGDVEDEESP